jgi:hypothetical protein
MYSVPVALGELGPASRITSFWSAPTIAHAPGADVTPPEALEPVMEVSGIVMFHIIPHSQSSGAVSCICIVGKVRVLRKFHTVGSLLKEFIASVEFQHANHPVD